MAKKETFDFGVKDLDGKPVPDSKITPVLRDIMASKGDYDADCKKGVNAYLGEQKIPLAQVDLNKYLVKYIAGLWRIREKPNASYQIIDVWNKKLVLGEKIDIEERDALGLEYYKAAEVHYDMFGVLTPTFNMFISKCNTVKGPMMRYGVTREEARAFLRGAIMDDDVFAPQIAGVVLGKKLKTR